MRSVTPLILALLLTLTGCSFLNSDGVTPPDNTDDQVQPEPQPEPDGKTYPASEHWDSLANLVERGMIRHTDEILWIADNLKALGHIEDLGRVDKYRAKRETLDESNRAYEANHLRGGN